LKRKERQGLQRQRRKDSFQDSKNNWNKA